MKRILFCIALTLAFNASIMASPIETIPYGAFGNVTIYNASTSPSGVVLFISGDGGWNKGVVDMAKSVAAQGAMVVGIDIQAYYKNIKKEKVKCYYLAGDFEQLSIALQKRYKVKQYLKPILVGYSSGATLAYGLLAQAPSNTFKGVISLGFCPDIETDKTLCDGTALKSHVLKEGKAYYLEACEKLTAPFIVLQGVGDKVCNYNDTKLFMKGMPFGELVTLSSVGHGFSVQKNWLPQFISAFKKIIDTPSYAVKTESIGDLPIISIPTKTNSTLPFAFVVSGDGGWTSFDQSFSETLAQRGIPVIGLDAQKYFWNAKTPEQATLDISKALDIYSKKWNKSSFILAGYSFGADIVPFVANRFSASLKDNLKGVYCFSPSETADFEIHIADMLHFNTTGNFNVLSEVKNINAKKITCIFGSQEDKTLISNFKATGVKVMFITGNHHFDENFEAMVDVVTK